MAGRRRGARGRRSVLLGSAAATRIARVGELIRRIVASELEGIDDDRLDMVSITSVDVDRALHRAIVWFTTLDGDNEPVAAEALDEYVGALRKAVGEQAGLRHTPRLEFRPDTVLRSAERIEDILRGCRGVGDREAGDREAGDREAGDREAGDREADCGSNDGRSGGSSDGS